MARNHYTLDMATKQMAPKKVLGFRGKKVQQPTGQGKVLSTRSVREIEDRYRIVTMRRDGYLVREIAETLGITEGKVRDQLQKSLELTINTLQETTEENRELAIERLDNLLRTYMPIAKGYVETVPDPDRPGQTKEITIRPNLNAAMFIVNLEARRAKLLALDKPETKKLEVTGIREYAGVDMDAV